MTRAPERAARALALLLALGAAPLAAQQPAPSGAQPVPAAGEAAPGLPEAQVYRREVFRYQAAGRPDPFAPLVGSNEMGVRVQDLRLLGIIYSSNARQSVAVFALPDSTERVRLRVGQRLGSVTVTGISQRAVQLREDEMGVSRTYSLEVPRAGRAAPPAQATGAAQAAPPPPQPAPGAPSGRRPR